MSKIVKLEIRNFRNIKDKIYEFKSNPTIISGKNGLGKSNSLNALMWMISGTLLTDNYGVGENDIDSIVPNDYSKGMHTEVAITFDSGAKFSKRYKTSFSRETDKINGHSTEWLINDVLQKNERVFLEEFYEQFEYKPAFKVSSIKELNLFVDPLYALQKLEAKQLRELLVSLGCSVSNEELYQSGFEDMRNYESKYLGKWDVMRLDLKKKCELIKKEKDSLEIKLETVADINEFKNEEIDILNKKKEKLLIQKETLKSGAMASVVKDIDMEIKEIETEKNMLMQKSINEIESDIKVLVTKRKFEEERLDAEENNRTSSIDEQIKKIQSKIANLESTISLYNKQIEMIKNDINSKVTEAKNLKEEQTNMTIKLNAVITRIYNNYLTCPHCGGDFPISQDDLDNFNSQKEADKQGLKENISKVNLQIQKIKEFIKLADNDYQKSIIEIESLNNQKLLLNNQLLDLEKEKNQISSNPIDRSSLVVFDKEINEKKNLLSTISFVEYDKKINELTNKKELLLAENQNKIAEELRLLDDTLLELEDDIAKLYVHKSKWEDKQNYNEKLKINVAELNDAEQLYIRVDCFIKTMISKINAKATQKTGINFVMLEENISNDGIKEVCYATINGVPFKDINTAEKLKAGVKFIEKLKNICTEEFGLNHNSLPILADRLEGIDDVEKIKNLTNEQLICTRVSTNEEIIILN